MEKKAVDIFGEIFKSYPDLGDETVARHIEKLKEIDEFYPPTLSFFLVTNTSLLKYEFVSKNFEYATGLSRDDMMSQGVNFWFGNFHPEDMQIWMVAIEDLMKFTMTEVALRDRERLSYTWNFRVRHSNGNYINIFSHQLPLYFDDLGKPIIGITHCTVTGDGRVKPIEASVKILNTRQEYETLLYKNYSQKMIPGGLTNRELDIVRLLALTCTSKEIGEKLFISSHTVDTHRRNILKKLGLNSTNQLIVYCKDHQLF